MCGIISGNKAISDDNIELALNSLSNRGPDSRNFCRIGETVFLGHTLLSITSEQPIIQPIWSNDRTLVGCVNGEIYNYEILRHFLETKGYVFQTDSDSEVIIHGVHWIGKDFVRYLNGEFCFVVYNTDSNEWICAVDTFGTKPLRYYLDKGEFLISSTVKALSVMNIAIQIDKKSCMFSLASQCLPMGRTLFIGIDTIPPSHTLTIDANMNSKLEHYKIGTPRPIAEVDYIESLLESAIIRRIPRHQNLSVVLSSGIDSSSIAYYLKKNNAKFQCFSIDFPGSIYSESNDIREFCKFHDISTTFIDITDTDLIINFPIVTLNSENLSINPHAVGKYLVNQEMIKQGYKVCMTGDGADELFYGYPHFYTNDKFQFLTDSAALGSRFPEIMTKSGKEMLDLECILKDSSGTAQELYYRYWLSEYGLKLLGDSQSASLGQEHRYPFLDTVLHNHIGSIEDFKLLNHPSKHVLRNIVRTWDSKLADMPKKPFTSPVIDQNWLPLFQKYVFENIKFFELDIFDKNLLIPYIERLTTDTLPNRIVLSQILSLGILTLELCNG